MSALADRRARAGSRPPAYRPLLLAMLSAQILTGIALWIVQFPLALLSVAPDSIGTSLWLPWPAHGLWSLLGAGGYVVIVCVLGGRLAATRVADRGIPRPAPVWSWLAFGASGYAGMALGHTGGARLVLAVVLAPLTLRLFAYRADGTIRPWPVRVGSGRRGVGPLLVIALTLTLSYSATHAFAQNGSGGTVAATLSPGASTVIDVGLRGVALPSRITAVTLDGPGAGALNVTRVVPTSQNGPGVAIDSLTEMSGPSIPVRLAPRAGTWLAIRVRLGACSPMAARIRAITLHYRVLGIATSERVGLWSAVRLACREGNPAVASLSE